MIQTTDQKIKCDVKDCKNMAAVYFPAKGKVGKVFLCKSCYDKIIAQAVAQRIPKSPKNTIKRIIDDKENNL